mgnify:CR=1 FL=1
MTIFEFAAGLDGREYGNEITPFEAQKAKEKGRGRLNNRRI